MSNFQLAGLAYEPFAELFTLSAAELAARGAVRMTADADFGFPCRVSLEDAAVGEELILLPYEHQPAHSPYRASGPIFVRRGAVRAVAPPGVVPPYVSRRAISVRAYDERHSMVDGQVVDGNDVASKLTALFQRPAVAYAHLHNAGRGCFSCAVSRVSSGAA